MNTILIIGIIQALFLTLLVLNKKNKSQSDHILILMLVYLALHQAFFLANFNEQVSVPLPIMIVGGGFPLLYGPMLLWYVQSLIREKPVRTGEYIIHSIPYLMFLVLFMYYHYQVEGSTVSVYDGYLHIQGHYPYAMRLYSIYFAISGAVYPIVSLVLLQLHRTNIHKQFSYEEEINLVWLKILIITTIGSFLLSFLTILFIVDWQWEDNPRYAFYIVSSVNTVFIFFIGYFGLKQTTIFSPQPFIGSLKSETEGSGESEATRYKKSGLDAGKSRDLLSQLDQVMADEKFFLDGKLTLSHLSGKLNVSTNHLSQAINENLQINFFDYVNNYRVEEVKKRIGDSQYNHLTLLGIAMDCGFNSKSSFNQIFKERTGMTPSEYKRSLN